MSSIPVGALGLFLVIATLFMVAERVCFVWIGRKFEPEGLQVSGNPVWQAVRIFLFFLANLVFAVAIIRVWPQYLRWYIVVAGLIGTSVFFYLLLPGSIWFRRVTGVLIALPISTCWVICPNWITADLATLVLALVAMLELKNTHFRYTIVAGIAIMAYDAVAVFGSSQMMELAASAIRYYVPVLMLVPKFPLVVNSEKLFALGLGDIVLPGILFIVAMREGRKVNELRVGYWTIVGYGLGLAVSVWTAVVMKIGQPATIYLIPCAFIALWISAKRYGLLEQMLRKDEPAKGKSKPIFLWLHSLWPKIKLVLRPTLGNSESEP